MRHKRDRLTFSTSQRMLMGQNAKDSREEEEEAEQEAEALEEQESNKKQQ